MIRKTHIFFKDNTLVSPKKYFARNLERCEPRNLVFSTAKTVESRNYSLADFTVVSFVLVNAVRNNKFLGSQSSKFL